MKLSTEDLSTNDLTATVQRRESVPSNGTREGFADISQVCPCKGENEGVFFDDASTLHGLYERYRRPICSYVFGILHSQEDASDVTQEVFVRAFKAWGGLRDREHLSAWLYRVATNLSVDLLRRRKLLSWQPLTRCRAGDPQSEGRVEDSASSLLRDSGGIPEIFEREQIRLTLASMPKEYAIVLILNAVQGVPYQEVGAIVGISPTAAATRVSRAKKMFRERYWHIDQAL